MQSGFLICVYLSLCAFWIVSDPRWSVSLVCLSLTAADNSEVWDVSILCTGHEWKWAVARSLPCRKQELFDLCALRARCGLHGMPSAQSAGSSGARKTPSLQLICFVSCRVTLNASCPFCCETLASPGMNTVFCSTVCLSLQKSAAHFRFSNSCRLLAQAALFFWNEFLFQRGKFKGDWIKNFLSAFPEEVVKSWMLHCLLNAGARVFWISVVLQWRRAEKRAYWHFALEIQSFWRVW